jgi:TonB-linked SusC/RagA family outer membrane protein
MKQRCLILIFVAGFLQATGIAHAKNEHSGKSVENAIVQQATRKISGVIKDTQGESIIGVNVKVKGGTVGTITDIDGKFSLDVSQGAILNISFVGYFPVEVSVGNNTNLQIVLQEDAKLLEEVVVVGYGSVKKANLTGAVDQISGASLESRPIVSVAQALQGSIPNLNVTSSTSTGTGGGGSPGARMNFNIRGITGLSGESSSSSASPLFVVDGIQSQDINAINPEDIESISVLKDAASAAIYGSSAPFGVVLITTKKGSKNAKPAVTYSANVGWASPINLPTQVNSVEWMKIMNEAGQNTRGTNFLDPSTMQRIQDYYDGKITTSTVAIPSRKEWASFDNFGEGLSNDNINWYDVYFKDNSFTQQHNVGLSGGTNNSSYYVGLGYNQKDGMLRYGTDSFNRYSARANLSSNVTNWLTANFRGSFTRGVTDKPNNTGDSNFMQHISQRWPIIPLINPDGRYSENSRIPNYLEGGRVVSTDDVNVLTGEFVITPLKGWNTTFNYTFTNNSVAEDANSLHFTLYDTDGVPYYSPGWTSDGFTKYTRGRDNLSRSRAIYEQQTINAFTSYETNLKGHYLKGLVGFAQEYFYNYRLAASGDGTLYTTDLPTFPTMYGTSNLSVGEPTKSTLTSRGVFGRINYGYKDKYLVELNGRYDGSSRYLSDVRFKFYPGVSAAWVASQEDFWDHDNSYVNFLKVRASYGSLGDQSSAGGYYPFYPSLGATAATSSTWLFNGNRYSALSYPGIINPGITWVTSTTVDFGFDITALQSRLSATFDWYRRMSDDVIGPAEELPAVLGAAAPATNNASLETNGFELTLGWRDAINGFSYGIKGTLADSKSVVKKYPNPSKLLSRWNVDRPIGEIWGYVTEGYYTQEEQNAGIDQDRQKRLGTNWTAGDVKYKNLDDDPLITPGESTLDNPGDRKVIGNSTPRYTFGVTLDAAWKGFDISAFFQGIGKRDAWIGDIAVGNFWGLSNSEWQANLLTIHKDRWTPETPNGYFPKYYLTGAQNEKNHVAQTKYLQDASYMRFKNLQIGYTVPKNVLNRAGISKLRVYVSGENLATFTDFIKTIDPEFLSNRGLIYPLQRTWSFGLNLSF